MKREKIIFILGNGFSVGMGFPSFSELYDICKTPIDHHTPLLSPNFNKFPFSYFEEQGIKNIELLLSIWQAYIQNYEDVMIDINPLKSTHAYLVEYLKTMCAHLVKYSTKATKTSLFNEFTRMIEEIITNDDISFITLNYDLVLERVAKKLDRRIEYINNSTKKDLIVRKLHGSVNWIESSEELASMNGYTYPTIWKEPGLIISSIDDSYDWPMPYLSISTPPVIIAPIISKSYKGIFKKILELATYELDTADKVIIVGYSFPEFDLIPRVIIQEAYKRNYNNQWKQFSYISSNDKDCKKAKDIFDKNIDIINDAWSTTLLKESLKK